MAERSRDNGYNRSIYNGCVSGLVDNCWAEEIKAPTVSVKWRPLTLMLRKECLNYIYTHSSRLSIISFPSFPESSFRFFSFFGSSTKPVDHEQHCETCRINSVNRKNTNHALLRDRQPSCVAGEDIQESSCRLGCLCRWNNC